MIFRRNLILTLALAAGLHCPAAQAATAIGQPAPALTVRELGGTVFDLAALRGQVVVVNFWASWCGPCRDEMPALDSFYRHYRDRGVTMLGLSVDEASDRAAVTEAMQGLSYPAALLEDASANGFAAPDFLPVSYVIDASGTVRALLWPAEQPVDEKALADAIEPLLAPPK